MITNHYFINKEPYGRLFTVFNFAKGVYKKLEKHYIE